MPAPDQAPSPEPTADPGIPDGARPFEKCDNSIALAEEIGLGTIRLEKIGVAGAAIEEVKFPFKGAG